ncbi:unnamed protein product [Mytilus coruscus]|uniref:Uncharacterized protein n=1 Tax=Mytilus coruscus TaxID=42192 RepID=A0A6J8E5U7_MYTCO|nr:unnamed protein product [Mytilus coruscus]
MCMTSTAIEIKENGFEYLDSVVLRAMVDRGGCTCDILIENHIVKTKIFIEKYKNMSAAAPENNVCGLAIDIKMLNDESVSNPIECTNGVDSRQFFIVKNGVLRFTSRIIPGNFTQGHCMHIIRDDDTLFIAIGICVGVLFLIIIAIIVTIITRRRTSNKRLHKLQKNTVPDSNQENEDPQYDEMQYNVLFVSTTQQQDTDINYSTVDLERSQISARHSEIDNHYNTVESNAKTRSLQTVQTFHDNKAIIKSETSKSSNDTRNLSPPYECSVVYTVVDKGLRNPIQNSSAKIQDDADPKQAYAIIQTLISIHSDDVYNVNVTFTAFGKRREFHLSKSSPPILPDELSVITVVRESTKSRYISLQQHGIGFNRETEGLGVFIVKMLQNSNDCFALDGIVYEDNHYLMIKSDKQNVNCSSLSAIRHFVHRRWYHSDEYGFKLKTASKKATKRFLLDGITSHPDSVLPIPGDVDAKVEILAWTDMSFTESFQNNSNTKTWSWILQNT